MNGALRHTVREREAQRERERDRERERERDKSERSHLCIVTADFTLTLSPLCPVEQEGAQVGQTGEHTHTDTFENTFHRLTVHLQYVHTHT